MSWRHIDESMWRKAAINCRTPKASLKREGVKASSLFRARARARVRARSSSSLSSSLPYIISIPGIPIPPMPPMPPIPPILMPSIEGAGVLDFGFGLSVIMAAMVINRPATDAA